MKRGKHNHRLAEYFATEQTPLSDRQIAKLVNVPKSTIQRYRDRRNIHDYRQRMEAYIAASRDVGAVYKDAYERGERRIAFTAHIAYALALLLLIAIFVIAVMAAV